MYIKSFKSYYYGKRTKQDFQMLIHKNSFTQLSYSLLQRRSFIREPTTPSLSCQRLCCIDGESLHGFLQKNDFDVFSHCQIIATKQGAQKSHGNGTVPVPIIVFGWTTNSRSQLVYVLKVTFCNLMAFLALVSTTLENIVGQYGKGQINRTEKKFIYNGIFFALITLCAVHEIHIL